MKKRKGIMGSILPVIIVFALYLVFFDSIASKPSDAGFWFILALGMSIGVALTRILQSSKGEK